MAPLRTERWVHEDGVEGLMNGLDVRQAPLDVDVCAFRIPARDVQGRWIRVHAHHRLRAEKFHGDREHTVPASEVHHGPTLDVASRVSEVCDLGRDSRGSRILLCGRRRMGQRIEGFQDSLELDLLRWAPLLERASHSSSHADARLVAAVPRGVITAVKSEAPCQSSVTRPSPSRRASSLCRSSKFKPRRISKNWFFFNPIEPRLSRSTRTLSRRPRSTARAASCRNARSTISIASALKASSTKVPV